MNMKKINFLSLSSIFFVLVIIFLLSGCYSKSKNETPPSITASPTSASDTNPKVTNSSISTPSQSAQATPKQEHNPSREAFVNFSAKDINGNTVDKTFFAQYKITLVNFWGTFCAPCKKEMPDLANLAKEMQGEGIGFLGIITDGESELDTAKTIIQNSKVEYVNIIPDNGIKKFMIKVNAVPTSYFVDKNADIIGEPIIGSMSKANFAKIIRERLAESLK